MIDLVITRFKENIEWSNKLIPKLNKRYVYNRGPSKLLSYDDKTIVYNIVNLGRESLTIFEHIVDNYENLPDSVLFLQGQLNDRPDHPTLPLEEYVNCTSNQIIGALRHKDQTYNWLGNGVNSKRTSLIEWQNTLDIFNKQGIYVRCNNFAIGRDIIKQFPKEYYQNIIDKSQLQQENPFSAYFVELSNIDIFLGKKTFTLLKLHTHRTNNKNDLQGIKGLEI